MTMAKSYEKKCQNYFPMAMYDHYDVATEMSPKSEFWKDGYCALCRRKW